MVKSPETEAVAEAIRAVMKREGLSGVDLADRLERVRGSALPYDKGVWVSKRTSGKIHLVEPVRVVYGPTEELKQIAEALKVPVDVLVQVANDRAAGTDSLGMQPHDPAHCDLDGAPHLGPCVDPQAADESDHH